MVFLPASFDEYAQKVVHYEADLDVEGNLIRDERGIVSMSYDPLKLCQCFQDDILCSSELKPTFEETLEAHFKEVEALIRRLSFH